MKAIALYLPQYHQIPENDKWWGEGYTEWSAVKNAKPYYKGHHEPRIPLNNNYYDLSDESAEAWQWQANLAREYGIYGFCIYHYWFQTGSQLLEKPMEILLRHPEIDINYCICWANETWTRTWYGIESEILKEQKYGGEDEWLNHFDYLLPFFKDKRYIKIQNKPVVNIYHTAEIKDLPEMKKYWCNLAKENGFDGVFFVSGNTISLLDDRDDVIDAYYNFEPSFTFKYKYPKLSRKVYQIRTLFATCLNKFLRNKVIEHRVSYDQISKLMKKNVRGSVANVFPGAFPQWDNTPRRKYKGTEFFGSSPLKFKQQIQFMKRMYPNAEFIYINAWNEWGEGCYLEPDELNGLAFLEIIKNEFKL